MLTRSFGWSLESLACRCTHLALSDSVESAGGGNTVLRWLFGILLRSFVVKMADANNGAACM